MQRYFAINKDLELSKEDKHHIINVMKMKLKEKFNIVYDKNIYECIINQIDKKDVHYTILKTLPLKQEKKYKIVLAVSLIKEQKFDLVLQKATELGVDEIIPLITDRTIIRIDNEANKINRWLKICKEASEQSHRQEIPIINKIVKVKDIINMKQELNILCSVNEVSINIKQVLQNKENYGTILVVIGPEGGFTAVEENLLIENGFISTSLGVNVLRAETVPLYILSVINYEFMR